MTPDLSYLYTFPLPLLKSGSYLLHTALCPDGHRCARTQVSTLPPAHPGVVKRCTAVPSLLFVIKPKLTSRQWHFLIPWIFLKPLMLSIKNNIFKQKKDLALVSEKTQTITPQTMKSKSQAKQQTSEKLSLTNKVYWLRYAINQWATCCLVFYFMLSITMAMLRLIPTTQVHQYMQAHQQLRSMLISAHSLQESIWWWRAGGWRGLYTLPLHMRLMTSDLAGGNRVGASGKTRQLCEELCVLRSEVETRAGGFLWF